MTDHKPLPKQQSPVQVAAKWQSCLVGLLIALTTFGFYLATLAPTVLWGDDALLQQHAYLARFEPELNNHWLWFQLAQLFAKLPLADAAYRVNLLSAVAATITVWLAYQLALTLQLSRSAACAVALSLAVSFTFWTHSVRAEVYSVYTVFMLLQLWLWFSWKEDKAYPLLFAALLSGLTILAHQLAILLIPGLLWLVWHRRNWLTRSFFAKLVVCGLVGSLPFIYVVTLYSDSFPFTHNLNLYFTHVGGVNFGQMMFDLSSRSLIRDLVLSMGLLGLQFVGIAGVLLIWGIWYLVQNKIVVPGIVLGIIYVTNLIFAFSYHVSDQFVFYLPSYIALTLVIGFGYQAAMEKRMIRSMIHHLSVLLGMVLLPIVVYAALPSLLQSANIDLFSARSLPGRDPFLFFLWPAKNGYMGAATFAHTALTSVPTNSVIIADFTPIQPLLYTQSIQQIRTDVRLAYPPVNMSEFISSLPPNTPLFLADTNTNYYYLDTLPVGATIQPHANIYHVIVSVPR